MKHTLHLPLKPFSINKMSYRDKRYKTVEAQDWSHTVLHHLSQEDNKQKLKELREFFEPKKHAYSIELGFFYPAEILHTKDGRISAKSHDLSNVEKPLIDLIFLPKYFDTPSPYGAENLNVDDKYLVDMKSSKRTSEDYKMIVKIEIIELEDL
jgi:hypothetical protein